MKKPAKSRAVVVAGDVTIDWNLACLRRVQNSGEAWNAEERTRACWQPGGAALLGELLRVLTEGLNRRRPAKYTLYAPPSLARSVDPCDGSYHHAYAIWSRVKEKNDQKVWRVAEFLGLDRGTSASLKKPSVRSQGPSKAELVLLDDAGLGFRDTPALWPHALKGRGSASWTLLKMARPVGQGPLWNHLLKRCPERLVVLMTVDDLRLTEVHISRGLSWERAAQDLFWELTHNPSVNALATAKHVIVSLGTSGAILLSRKDLDRKRTKAAPRHECTLFFDPVEIEDTWSQKHEGHMIGYTSSLAASIARHLLLRPANPDLGAAVQSGLHAMRTLHLNGYTEQGCCTDESRLVFPSEAIVKALAEDKVVLAQAQVEDPVRFLTASAGQRDSRSEARYWTILNDENRERLKETARHVVLEGPEKALESVPLGKFGALTTADRREIESFRGIANLIKEYCDGSQPRPLSFAVFGPPGAGKSFGVVQVAKSLKVPGIEKKSFNLSQFANPNDLLSAFHQVRDIVLKGGIPLVFWDEFDTTLGDEPLGWLRYFLAPMQDGEFQQGQVTHPIGKCIFVFAGGTCEHMDKFNRSPEDEEFRRVKGPDFVSRLKGYVNILGPNPNPSAGSSADPFHLIRRAILLRSMLERNVPQIFQDGDGKGLPNIDPGVLHGLLHVSKYHHGARSMESVLAMSLLAGKGRFERSCLPAEDQLDVHVNGRAFLSLVQQVELTGELLETLAAAAHQVYCDGKKRDGWKWGPKRDEKNKIHPLLVPYDRLDEVYKESNRATVRYIPKKLDEAGYVMVPSRSNEPPIQFPGDDLEKLARLEHDLWMKEKQAQGFTVGEPTEADPLRNPHLVPWEEVEEGIRQIDRDLIRGIPKILAKAGYAIVKLQRPGAADGK